MEDGKLCAKVALEGAASGGGRCPGVARGVRKRRRDAFGWRSRTPQAGEGRVRVALAGAASGGRTGGGGGHGGRKRPSFLGLSGVSSAPMAQRPRLRHPPRPCARPPPRRARRRGRRLSHRPRPRRPARAHRRRRRGDHPRQRSRRRGRARPRARGAARSSPTAPSACDNVDLAACRRRGIVVTNTPDVLTDATADLTFALILAPVGASPRAIAWCAPARWRASRSPRCSGSASPGASLGIVGLGRIGRAVAQRARGFSMRVRYTQRAPRRSGGRAGAPAAYVEPRRAARRERHRLPVLPARRVDARPDLARADRADEARRGARQHGARRLRRRGRGRRGAALRAARRRGARRVRRASPRSIRRSSPARTRCSRRTSAAPIAPTREAMASLAGGVGDRRPRRARAAGTPSADGARGDQRSKTHGIERPCRARSRSSQSTIRGVTSRAVVASAEPAITSTA